MADVNKKVLVIDDNVDTYDLIQRTFRGSEFEAFHAENGRDGIQLAKTTVPDLIILDIMMPHFDGFMTSNVLQRNVTTKSIPIIFLSGRKSKEDIQTAIKSGGVDYVVKPFSPSDLLTRIRKVMETHAVIERKKDVSKQDGSETESAHAEHTHEQALLKFAQFGDIKVLSSRLLGIQLKNCQIYRDAFKNIISDGLFTIVFDMAYIQKIDSAGLAILLSVHESLVAYNGRLTITSPSNELNTRFSFAPLNTLFDTYDSIQDAVESIQQNDHTAEKNETAEEANICLSCTYLNIPGARYCGFCGTNLVISKGERILEILKKTILKRVVAESGAKTIEEFQKRHDSASEPLPVPQEFDLEFINEQATITCRGTLIEEHDKAGKHAISIRLPRINDTTLPVGPGVQVIIRNATPGIDDVYRTHVESVDPEQSSVSIPYSEEARILHSIKNFSIAPKSPIPVFFTVPNLQYSGDILTGKILELSRVRITVFSDNLLPENKCLAASFELPDGNEITSSLVIAQKGRGNFMYNIEFVIIDEREKTKIIQYMYKRQIELAKTTLE